MSEKKNAQADAATSARAMEEIERNSSHNQSITGCTVSQCGICSVLHEGQENALSAREIARITGATQREVTRAIEVARLSGNPVCACRWGYYLPETTDDLRHYVHAFDRRLRHIKNTRAALEDMIIKASGQTTLEGVD